MGDVNYPSLITFLTTHSTEPTNNFRATWLDPIRDHPRYRAVVERLQACLDALTLS